MSRKFPKRDSRPGKSHGTDALVTETKQTQAMAEQRLHAEAVDAQDLFTEAAMAAQDLPPVEAGLAPTDALGIEPQPLGSAEFPLINQEVTPNPPPVTVGQRLALARESIGWSRAELGSRARIPLGAIESIEADDLDALGATVYVKGFLRSYARAVGFPDALVDARIAELADSVRPEVTIPPPSFGARMSARYATPLIYATLTLVVLVPLVFLAAPAVKRAPLPMAALDAPSLESVPPVTASAPVPTPALNPPAVLQQNSRPVMASMAPMAAPASTAAPTLPAGTRLVVLEVSGPTWVDFARADGGRLEYAQLSAGTRREYTFTGEATLIVGNAPAVTLTVDGRPVDLNEFARGNVARLRVAATLTPARP